MAVRAWRAGGSNPYPFRHLGGGFVVFGAHVLDVAALAFLLVGLVAMWKVLRANHSTPNNWVGSHKEFEQRIQRETRWGTIGWLFLIVAALITMIDVIVK